MSLLEMLFSKIRNGLHAHNAESEDLAIKRERFYSVRKVLCEEVERKGGRAPDIEGLGKPPPKRNNGAG